MHRLCARGRLAAGVLLACAVVVQSAEAGLTIEGPDFPDGFADGLNLPLTAGYDRITGAVPDVNDQDWFRFHLNEGDWLVIDSVRLASANPVDTEFFLFDPEGAIVAFNDDSDAQAPVGSFGSTIAPYQAQRTGSYALAITGFDNTALASIGVGTEPLAWSGDKTEEGQIGYTEFSDAGESDGEYHTEVMRFQPVTTINESSAGGFGDTRATAFDLGPISPGTVTEIDGQIDVRTDVDFIKVPLAEGQLVYLDTDIVEEEADTMLSIFDSSGRLLAFSDDNAGNGFGIKRTGAVIGPFEAPADDEYFIAVTTFDNEPTARLTQDLITNPDNFEELTISGDYYPNTTPDDSFTGDNDGFPDNTGAYGLLIFIADEEAGEEVVPLPEPTSAALLAVAAVVGLRRRRR